MTDRKPNHRWFELNNRVIIEAMLKDPDSKHWDECSRYIRSFIEKHFASLRPHIKDEIVQDIMFSVHKGLPTFRYQCKFTTWLAIIARNRAIDVGQQQAIIAQWEIHREDSPEHYKDESEHLITNISRTPEEVALTNELVRETFAALETFIQTHGKPERNRQILQLVLLDGHSHQETAEKLGVSAPVVGYIVRSAQEYVRQKRDRP